MSDTVCDNIEINYDAPKGFDRKTYMREYMRKRYGFKPREVKYNIVSENITEYQKEYYAINKDKLKDYKKSEVFCVCGVKTNKAHLARHMKSKTHLRSLESLSFSESEISQIEQSTDSLTDLQTDLEVPSSESISA